MEQGKIAYVIIALLVKIHVGELAPGVVNVTELVTDKALLFTMITGQCEVAWVVKVQINLQGKGLRFIKPSY